MFNSLGKVKKHMLLVRISIKKRAGGRGFFLYVLFTIARFLYTLLPSPRYVGALRSNINKTKHQILIKHKFVYCAFQ